MGPRFPAESILRFGTVDDFRIHQIIETWSGAVSQEACRLFA